MCCKLHIPEESSIKEFIKPLLQVIAVHPVYLRFNVMK